MKALAFPGAVWCSHLEVVQSPFQLALCLQGSWLGARTALPTSITMYSSTRAGTGAAAYVARGERQQDISPRL